MGKQPVSDGFASLIGGISKKTLDKWPLHRMATYRHTGQTTMHKNSQTPKGDLERVVNVAGMILDSGRKPEYVEYCKATVLPKIIIINNYWNKYGHISNNQTQNL